MTYTITSPGVSAFGTLRRLKLLPVRLVDVPSAAAAVGSSEEAVATDLAALAAAQFVHDAGYQAGRGQTWELLSEPPAGASVRPTRTLRRWLQWLLQTTRAAQELATTGHCDTEGDGIDSLPFADEQVAVQWLLAHHEDIVGGIYAAADLGWSWLAWPLADVGSSAAPREDHAALTEWLELYTCCIAAAQQWDDRATERQALLRGSDLLRHLGLCAESVAWAKRARAQMVEDSGVPTPTQMPPTREETCHGALENHAALDTHARVSDSHLSPAEH